MRAGLELEIVDVAVNDSSQFGLLVDSNSQIGKLIRRIGLERVEALENRKYEPGKWSADELRAIRDDYRKRCRELEKQLSEM